MVYAAMAGLGCMADEQFAVGVNSNSSDEVPCNGPFFRLLVLLLTFEDMFVLGCVWSLRFSNLL